MKNYKLAKTFNVFAFDNKVILNKGANQNEISLEKWEKNKILFNFIIENEPFTLRDINQFASDNNIDDDILLYIKNGSVLITFDFNENDNLSRSDLFLNYIIKNGDFNYIKNKINEFNFIIIGTGGLAHLFLLFLRH